MPLACFAVTYIQFQLNNSQSKRIPSCRARCLCELVLQSNTHRSLDSSSPAAAQSSLPNLIFMLSHYTAIAASGRGSESLRMLANRLFFSFALPRRKRSTSGRLASFSSQSVCFRPACSMLARPIATRQSPGLTAAVCPELRRTMSFVDLIFVSRFGSCKQEITKSARVLHPT